MILPVSIMRTLQNGNHFCIPSPPLFYSQKDSNAELYLCQPQQPVEQTVPVIWDIMNIMWYHCNDTMINILPRLYGFDLLLSLPLLIGIIQLSNCDMLAVCQSQWPYVRNCTEWGSVTYLHFCTHNISALIVCLFCHLICLSHSIINLWLSARLQ